MNLQLAPNFVLPLEAVTESLAILAVKRAGKSYTAKKFAEQLVKAKQQVVIVDPKGDWWGVRSSADGKAAGLPIVIFGGEHADVPLEVGAGELVGRLAVEQRVSMLLDLSQFRKHEAATFMAFFLETVYRLKAKSEFQTPMMLIVDEADAIAPQQSKGMRTQGVFDNTARMLGAAEDIVRRGGQRGIGITLVSQRAAVLNKNVLTQCGIIVLLRTTGSQDIDAVDDWIKKHGEPEHRKLVMDSIGSLPKGTAWFWAPGWPDEKGIFRQVEIGACETFDSGRTPKPGEVRVEPKTLADVNLGDIQKQMASTIEKVKADDPKELRKKIAELTKSLADAQKEKPAQIVRDENAITQAVIDATSPLVQRIDTYETVFSEIGEIAQRLADLCKDRVEISALVRKVEAQKPKPVNPLPPPRVVKPVVPPQAPGEVPHGCAKPLAALAAVYPSGLTEAQWATAAGYKRSGGTWGTYKSRLRGAGLIESREGRWFATEAGAGAVGDVELPPSPGPDLVRWWAAKLAGTSKIAEALIEAWPDGLSREALAERVDMAVGGGSFGTYLSRLAGPGLITRDGGMIRLADEVMG